VLPQLSHGCQHDCWVSLLQAWSVSSDEAGGPARHDGMYAVCADACALLCHACDYCGPRFGVREHAMGAIVNGMGLPQQLA